MIHTERLQNRWLQEIQFHPENRSSAESTGRPGSLADALSKICGDA
jgi:hypothetical protein